MDLPDLSLLCVEYEGAEWARAVVRHLRSGVPVDASELQPGQVSPPPAPPLSIRDAPASVWTDDTPITSVRRAPPAVSCRERGAD